MVNLVLIYLNTCHEVKPREKLADASHNGEMCASTRIISLTEQDTCNDQPCFDPLCKFYPIVWKFQESFDYFAVVLRRKEGGNVAEYFEKSFEEYKNGFESKGEYGVFSTEN